MKGKSINYGISAFSFIAVYLLSYQSSSILHAIESNQEHELLISFFLISVVLVISSIVAHIARLTKLPSFVIAIFFGMAIKPLIAPIVDNKESLSVIVGLGATLILFSGGLETPFASFKKLIGKIASLSFVGLFITACATSLVLFGLSIFLGTGTSIVAAVLLGAVLASTDPAAIIPILKRLRFQNRSVKDIIVSESAVTDVTGTLVTVVFLTLIASGVTYTNIFSWYGAIASGASLLILFKQLFLGVILGLVGYGLLEALLHFKKKSNHTHEADIPFFLFVPIIIFVTAHIFGGSGYLAAFIAGLLFHLTDHLKETEHFFNSLVEGFFKPTIFILLGALVDVKTLIAYAPIGIIAALCFMFLIRPFSVFISLIGFRFWGKEKMSWNDLLFISFVRETGAIPAVLLVTIASLGLPQTDGLIEIGMWIILCTLIIAPPLTPKVASLLRVATPIEDDKNDPILPLPPAIMLVSRGHGFIKRLGIVSDFAVKHKISKIVLLLCLEEKYTEALEQEIEHTAHIEFDKINQQLLQHHKRKIEFIFISRKGLLQDNINSISDNSAHSITMLFAGRKILDFYLDEIKQLSIPIRFID